MMRSFGMSMEPLALLSERDDLYKILANVDPHNIDQDWTVRRLGGVFVAAWSVVDISSFCRSPTSSQHSFTPCMFSPPFNESGGRVIPSIPRRDTRQSLSAAPTCPSTTTSNEDACLAVTTANRNLSDQ